jgi:chemotaxis protein methyltransferase CheR
VTLPPADFDYVSRLVRRASAISLPRSKDYLVEARLLPVARDTGLGSVLELVAELRRDDDDDLRRRVVDAMTTNETSWLRDRYPFHALGSELLDGLLASRRNDGVLRVWSAGCSSGQEPYSIAMTVAKRVAAAGLRLDLLATDLSESMLERGREGLYSDFEMRRGLPQDLREQHFTKVDTGWQISPELRAAVDFRHLNLAAPFPVLPPMDVVFLRNVLIYFEPEVKACVLGRVGQLLRPDGYLFLGAAETTINVDDRFERVTIGGTTVYQFGGKAAA